MTINFPTARRYARIDAWRGYPVPRFAVMGASDTGDYEDSPAPTEDVKRELRRFQREVLQPLGIKSETRIGDSSNVFCCKRWLCVPQARFVEAAEAAVVWLESNRRSTRYVHDAELKQLQVEAN